MHADDFVPVRSCWQEMGVGTGYVVFILVVSALQFYKQETLRRTSPIAFASMTKVFQGVLFLIFIAYKSSAGKWFNKEGLAPLFEHANHINRFVLGFFIALLCVLGAVTLALDSIAFIYLDLSTKQVIDSMSPAVMLVVSAIMIGILDMCKPVRYSQMSRQHEAVTERRVKNTLMTSLRALLITLMVVSSVWVVWATPEVSVLGVTVNSITLVTSAVGSVLLETILKWKAYSDFGLMLWTIAPEIAVLSAISWQLKEPFPTNIYILHAGIVAVVETGIKVLAFYLLRRTSAVDLSVSGVLVFAIVVAGDTVRSGKASTMRICALVATFVFFTTYSMLAYYGRKRELRLKEKSIDRTGGVDRLERLDPVLGIPIWDGEFHNGLFGLTGLHGYESSFGVAPSRPLTPDKDLVGTREVSLELDEYSFSVDDDDGGGAGLTTVARGSTTSSSSSSGSCAIRRDTYYGGSSGSYS